MSNKQCGKCIILFIGVWIASYATRTLLAPLLREISRLWHLDNAQLGWLSGSLFLSYMIFQLPSGILADKFGRKKLLILGLAIQSIGVLLSALARNETMFVVSRLLSGMGQSALFITLFSLVPTLIPLDKQIISTAIIHAAIPVGSLVGMGLSTELVLARGKTWTVPFFLTAAFSILVSFAAFRILGWEQNGKGIGNSAASGTQETPSPVKPSRQLLALSVIAFLEGFGTNVVLSWLPTYLSTKGFTGAESGRLAAFAMLTAVPATFLVGQAANSIGKIKTLLLSLMGVTLMVYVGIVLSADRDVLLLLLLLFGAVSKITTAPMHIVLLNRTLGNNRRSTGLGVFNTFSALSMFSAPVITGALLDVFKGFNVPWLLVAGFQILAIILMSLMVSENVQQTALVEEG